MLEHGVLSRPYRLQCDQDSADRARQREDHKKRSTQPRAYSQTGGVASDVAKNEGHAAVSRLRPRVPQRPASSLRGHTQGLAPQQMARGHWHLRKLCAQKQFRVGGDRHRATRRSSDWSSAVCGETARSERRTHDQDRDFLPRSKHWPPPVCSAQGRGSPTRKPPAC